MGVAVKVMGSPWQMVVAGVAMVTEGVRVGVTVTAFDDVGEVAQETKAVTLTLPLLVPGKACIEVPEVVPLHPEGKVQV